MPKVPSVVCLEREKEFNPSTKNMVQKMDNETNDY